MCCVCPHFCHKASFQNIFFSFLESRDTVAALKKYMAHAWRWPRFLRGWINPNVLIKNRRANRLWNKRKWGEAGKARGQSGSAAAHLAFLEASGRSIFTATRRGRPFLTLKGNSKLGRSWGLSISHRCTCFGFFFFFLERIDKGRQVSVPLSPLADRATPRGLHPSPLRTGPRPTSPWRWDSGGGSLAAARRRPRGWRRPAPARHRCCCRWRPAGWRCRPRRSGGRLEAAGGTPGVTGMGREGSPGRGEVRPGLEVKSSPAPCPKRRLWRGQGGGWRGGTAVRLKLKT